MLGAAAGEGRYGAGKGGAMNQPITEKHYYNANGAPEGGVTYGTGFAISWQRGPLGRHTPECRHVGGARPPGCTREEPNGAFVEGIIAAAIGRIECYQNSPFKCDENARALDSLRVALAHLESRTANREARKVEGTHAV